MNRLALLPLIFAGCSGAPAELPSAPAPTASTFLDRAFERVAQGDIQGALNDLDESLAREPENAEAFALRGNLLSKENRYAEAIEALNQALAIDPSLFSAQNDLAWLLATCPDDSLRNGKRALELCKIAVAHGHQDWQFGDTLAASFAETGDYSEAMRAIRLAIEDAPERYRGELERHLKCYVAGQPWRE